MRRLVIATRGSDLAMWQAGFVAAAYLYLIKKRFSEVNFTCADCHVGR